MESEIAIGVVLGWVVIFLVVIFLIFLTLNHRLKILQHEQENQKKIYKANIEAEENLKEKITNDLHDEIIPLLTALKHSTQQHKNKHNDEDFNKDLQLITQSIDGMREVARNLIPTTFLNFGLIKAIEQAVNRLGNEDILVEFEASEALNLKVPFSKSKQLNIYRISNEILSNLSKHSEFTLLKVYVKMEQKFTIQFVHDGKKITNEDIETFTEISSGFGLKSLKSRTFLLNGKINYSHINDVPTITLEVPNDYE